MATTSTAFATVALLIATSASTATAQLTSCNDYDGGATSTDTPSIATFVLLIFMGSLVMFMQAGFAMVEAGSIGVTSVVSVLFKNMGDCLIGALAWFVFGWAFAYGDHQGRDPDQPTSSTEWFIGDSGYFMQNLNPCRYPEWFYQWTFAATTATIVSGAMAGRTQLVAYLIYTLWLVSFVYPTIVHWTWSGTAWLAQGGIDNLDAGIGYFDYAGSGIVHCTGGTAALIGAWMVGPRGVKEFDLDGIPAFESVKDKSQIHGHSMPLVALGTLILFFGFLGFNGGSVLVLDSFENGVTMSLAVVNTVLAASGGGLAAVTLEWFFNEYWSLMQMCNGSIAGMVAICAGASTVYPWAAWIIGFIAGLVYRGASRAVMKLGIDDPIDAAAVHLGGGAWGVIAVCFFAMDKDKAVSQFGVTGLFYGGTQDGWVRLGWNLLGLFIIIGWTAVNMLAIFKLLSVFNKLRVEDATISGFGGLDKAEHGEYAYVLTPHRDGTVLTPTNVEDHHTVAHPASPIKTSAI